MKALINLGRESSVDFHENPVLHCMSILSPVVVVVLLAVTAFQHFNNHNIKRVTQTKSLGLIVDENLSWEAQFNRTMDKINSGIWALKRLKIYSLSHYFPLSIMHWLKVNYVMVMLFG